jgi:hypothetical protein
VFNDTLVINFLDNGPFYDGITGKSTGDPTVSGSFWSYARGSLERSMPEMEKEDAPRRNSQPFDRALAFWNQPAGMGSCCASHYQYFPNTFGGCW